MEESEDLQGNVLKLSSVRLGGGLKSTASGRSTPRSSPSFRRLRTPRRELKGVWGKVQWFSGNRLLIWLMIIVVWAYAGFYIQSNWAHNEQSKADFIGYTSKVRGVEKVEDANRTIDTLVNDVTNSTGLNPVILRGNEENGSNFGMNLFGKQGNVTFSKNATTRRSNKRIARRLRRKRRFRPKVVPVENEGVEVDEGIPRKNTSYGLFVGPFRKIEDDILGWKGKKKRGTCDSQSEFAQRVLSRKFVLVFHELSMTGAPLSMMELATEILSCGGTVSVVALSQRGGLMGELTRRGIKVLNDKAELSYKVAIKADLVVAGSAVCSSWIEKYLSHYNSASNQILWWIMENRREYFDRSKDMLDKVKSVAFLSELQSEQWLTWCKEEHIQLKTQPTIVPLSVNDELAFVAGIPCSLNIPSLTVEKMLEKKTLLRVAVRKEMGLADDDMLVMSLSSINPGKGQRLFLESVVLMSEQKVPSVDHKINSLKNLSDIGLQDEKVAHGRQLRGQFQHADELGNVIPQSNKSKDGDVRKRRENHSRLSNIVSSITSHKYQSQDAHASRNLLSESSGREYPTPKILIGSIGSKSNKVLYVKEILRFLSQHSNMSKSLLWTPATTRVSSLYAAADVYVINAQGLGETFGRVTIEAMAFGLPVLGTDAGGTKEIVKDKVMGLLHPIGRNGILPLAQNLQFLLSNPSARKQLGKNGRMKVEQTYLKQHMYKKLADIFAQCMKIK